MARQDVAFLSWNRGLVSRLGLARIDIKRIALSAETYNNYIPLVLGSMSIRPGLGYLGTVLNNLAARFLAFIFSTSDKAAIELTNLNMRVWVSDAVITRPAVTTAVTNGTFTTDLTGWTDADESGAASIWVAPGYMQLLGTGTNAAIRTQQVAVTGANIGVEHGLKIVIARGPVTLRVGSTSGGDEYITETALDTGVHSLAVTPTGDLYIRFQSRVDRFVWVDSIEIEAAGAMTVTTSWTAAKLNSIRSAPSGDILFCAASGIQQYKIERRGTRSWSVVKYLADDGPFRTQNIGPGTLAPSVLAGNGTLTASIPTFRTGHVGALFYVVSTGQTVVKSAAALNDATNPLLVEGVGTDRSFTIIISGMTGGGRTVILERSFDNTTWVAVSGKSWTIDTTESYNDTLDNQTVYYRLLLSVVGTAGTTTLTLSIATGSIRGIGRVTAYTSALVVDMEVLEAFGATTASSNWAEGKWSDYRGWPAAPCLHDGRLNWWGKDRLNGSVPDDYPSHDQDVEGDSGPVDRSIGKGPVDVMFWALSLARMISGGAGGIYAARTSALDEPITPSGVAVRQVSSQGSSSVAAVAIDEGAVFASRSGQRVYELKPDDSGWRMVVEDLTLLCPEFCEAGVTSIAVQHQPETRVHCVLSDGTVACLTYDRAEDVRAWWLFEMYADTEEVVDVVVLPGDGTEDAVYYVIRSGTTYCLAKFALESECEGGSMNKQADLFVSSTTAGTTLTVPTFLNGRTLYLWGDGEARGTAVVSAGSVTFPASYTNRMAGLYYEARFRSARLGKALGRRQPIQSIALLTHNTAPSGVEYGRNFTTMYPLPAVVNGTAVDADTVLEEYDEPAVAIGGVWRPNERLCIKAAAPNPARVLAAVVTTES